MANFFISISDLRNYRDIGRSVRAEQVEPYIRETQDYDLRPILTPEFYSEVIEVLASGSDSANGKLTKANFDLLVPYIVPVVSYFTLGRLYVNTRYLLSSYGTVSKENEHSDKTSAATLQRLQAGVLTAANAEVARLTEFLLANTDKYPTYNEKKNETKDRLSFRIGGLY